MIENLQAVITAAAANTWIALKLVVVVYAVGLLLERLAPAQRGQPWNHVVFNLAYTVPFIFLTHLLVPPLSGITQPWTATWGGWLLVQMPAGLGWQLLQGLLFFLVFDFFYYWLHRLQHVSPWLWSQHKLHHADRSVNVTSGQRHHWLEEPLRVFIVFLPMAIVFQLSPPTIAWLWSGLLLWGYVIHLNLRIPFGPLTPVFAGPQLHRLHHSVEPEHMDVNFAAFFPLWDIVFGTYVAPKRGEWPATGVHDGEDMNHLSTALFSPFRDWRRRLARPRPERPLG
jgi:sterol desaturase/sphingolipid hydroxylase (fatty acid hydroxylase superfamily)